MYERQNKKTLASVLRHRVTIQTATITLDGEGGDLQTWTDTITNAPASVDPIQARQQYLNRAVNVDATHVIKMRGDVTVVETQRIKWGSRVFEILTIEDIGEIGALQWITTKERR